MPQKKLTTNRRFHPLANLFPMMGEDELRELADDIRENGLREPIKIDAEGTIIDGRNRFLACQQLGVEPWLERVEGEERALFALVVSANLKRRHLTTSQRAMIAAELRAEAERLNLDKPPLRSAAESLNVNHETVRKADEVLAKGTPELVKAVKEAAIPVSRAAAIATKPAREQRRAVKAAATRSTPTRKQERHGDPYERNRERDVKAIADRAELLQAIGAILRPAFDSLDLMSHGSLKRDVIALMDRLSPEVRVGGRRLITEVAGSLPEIPQ